MVSGEWCVVRVGVRAKGNHRLAAASSLPRWLKSASCLVRVRVRARVRVRVRARVRVRVRED